MSCRLATREEIIAFLDNQFPGFVDLTTLETSSIDDVRAAYATAVRTKSPDEIFPHWTSAHRAKAGAELSWYKPKRFNAHQHAIQIIYEYRYVPNLD